jgi:hypothetical protein
MISLEVDPSALLGSSTPIPASPEAKASPSDAGLVGVKPSFYVDAGTHRAQGWMKLRASAMGPIAGIG